MISMARTFGAPDTVPAGKAGRKRIERVVFRRELALDVRDDVHHVAVALDEELVGHLHGADLGDAADIVAAEIEQHQVLGALLRIGEQLAPRRPCPRAGSSPRGTRAGDRAHRDGAVAHAHQDFRARARDREAAEIEEEQRTAPD